MSKLTITHDLQFRGTLQRFLAEIMPLTHMTGVNFIGKFNDQNTTSIETQNEIKEKTTNERRSSSKESTTVNTSELKVYKHFWSIQKYLNNPFLVSLFC